MKEFLIERLKKEAFSTILLMMAVWLLWASLEKRTEQLIEVMSSDPVMEENLLNYDVISEDELKKIKSKMKKEITKEK